MNTLDFLLQRFYYRLIRKDKIDYCQMTHDLIYHVIELEKKLESFTEY
jgi:hypothetical protein